MAGNRITLTLDYPFTEMIGEGWGMSKLAGAFTFIDRTGSGESTKIIETGVPDEFWKVPTMGVLTLVPNAIQLGEVQYSETSSDFVYTDSEVEIASNVSGGPALGLMEMSGGHTRTRASREDPLIGLIGSAAQTAILAQLSLKLKTVWRTKNVLKPNEAWGGLVAPRRTFDGLNTNAYVAFLFAQYYCLGVDLQGTARLHENAGTEADPHWVVRKRMDLASIGIDATKPWAFYVFPVGGRYIVFRFGNVRYRMDGFRLTRYEETKDFRFDLVNEGRGNRWDAALNQYIATEAGKLSVAVNETGTDYTFQIKKIRYSTTPQVARLGAEPLPYPVPGQTPELAPKGYAGGYTQGGGGSMSVTLENGQGLPWDDDSEKVCPVVTMAASSDGVYTPELWYLDANVYPETHVPAWTPYDASAEWMYLRFSRSIDPRPCAAEITLKGEARYDRLFNRGGPFRLAVDGQPVLDGYFHTRRPTLGPTLVEEEGNARDMWDRLKVSCGAFESLDSKSIGQTFHRLLRRCGFTDAQIQIEDDNLKGLTFGDFDEPQSLKLYNEDTLVDEAIRDIVQHTSLQGIEGIRCRWDGSKWRIYLAKRQGTGDPDLILYSTDDWDADDGTPLGELDEDERWARKFLRITSHLEFDVQNPEFNALSGKCASEGGYASAIVVPPPQEEYTSDFANLPTNPRAQAFEGRIRSKTVGPPEITATTFYELRKQLRFIYEDEMSKTLGQGVQAEWQPFADADIECAVIGKNPITGQTVSYGVWNIEHIDVDVHADDQHEKNWDGTEKLDAEGDPIVIRRAYEWSGAYRLRWRRATTEEFVVPMFGGSLPPESY